MSFLHPAILAAGLLAIAIPIIIHFLRRRRRPIEWAAMRFLQDALRKRRRRLRLEQLLLLLTRCAIVALLAIAIARPTSGGDISSLPTTHIIAIDNSIGSGTDAGGTSDFDRAAEKVREIIARVEASPGDTVALLSMGSPGDWQVLPATADAGIARRSLSRVSPTASTATLDALRRSLTEAVVDTQDEPGASRTVLHIVSAWRSSGTQAAFEERFETDPFDGIDEIEVHTVGTADPGRANIGIASIVASTPTVVGNAALAPQTRVSGTLVRSAAGDAMLAEQSVEIELTARPSGTIAGRASARFEAGQTDLNWSIAVNESALVAGRGGRIALAAEIRSDDANPLDNRAEIVITRKRELRAAVVERPPIGATNAITPGTWVLAALSPDDRAGVSSFRIDPASLGSIPAGSVDAMFILEPSRVAESGWTRASELLGMGGLVVITPDANTGAGADTRSWAEPLSRLSDGQISIHHEAGIRTGRERLSRAEPGGLLGSLRGEFSELIGSVGVRQRINLDAGSGAISPVMIDTDDGQPAAPFMTQTSARGTLVVLCAPFDVEWTDLPARPVFVPVVQELLRRGSGLGIDNSLVAGVDDSALEPTANIDRWTFDQDASGDLPTGGPPGAHTGIWLGLGSNGQVIQTLTIRPDAQAAKLERINAQTLDASLESLFPGVPISRDGPDGTAQTKSRTMSAWGDRLALLVFAACAALAIAEALIARTASHPAGAAA